MKPSKKKPVEVQDVPSFLQEIYKLKRHDGIRCFRGEANNTWPLKPSALRDLKPDAERHIISELTLEAVSEFDADKSMFRKLVRAQHYGLPTRLLDVSLNPLVALFFACADDGQMKADATVLILEFNRERIKFADSDTVSVLCNLANLSDSEKKAINDTLYEYKSGRKRNTDAKKNLKEMQEIDRLIQFVRVEKPYFRNEVVPSDLKRYFFVHPPKNNRRIVAQSGAFVVAGLLQYSNAENAASFTLNKIHVPAKSKERILKELDAININNRTMFPEVEFTSRYIKKKWTQKYDDGEFPDESALPIDDLL